MVECQRVGRIERARFILRYGTRANRADAQEVAGQALLQDRSLNVTNDAHLNVSRRELNHDNVGDGRREPPNGGCGGLTTGPRWDRRRTVVKRGWFAVSRTRDSRARD